MKQNKQLIALIMKRNNKSQSNKMISMDIGRGERGEDFKLSTSDNFLITGFFLC